MDTWRYISEGACPASYNMAADAFLLSVAEDNTSLPVVRLYAWDKPSITIGYHQKLQRAVDVAALGRTPVVRRITGGRALVHDDGEITYAVAGNFSRFPVLGANLHESYYKISRAIVFFYRSLGWSAEISRRDDPLKLNNSGSTQKGCFASVSQYEIILDGQKIAAGSQRRTKTAFMQHGAIKIAPPRIHPAISDLPQAIDNKRLIIKGQTPEELRKKLLSAFEKTFDVHLVERPFEPIEIGEIRARTLDFDNLNNYR